jgi:hypothetical protein
VSCASIRLMPPVSSGPALPGEMISMDSRLYFPFKNR